ncbi:MAG: YIP1 family protein [Bacteroidota bacterium]|nr:YIP1 family protein [Bacteroidota bacterium]
MNLNENITPEEENFELADSEIQNTLPEEEHFELSDREIFTKIWTSPRLVFKYLNDKNYDKFVFTLLILVGIAKTFDRASAKNMGDNMPLIAVLSICIIIGGLLGWISIYICAAVMSWTGKWLNGQGNTNSLVRMISYASIPSSLALIVLIPQIALFGNGMFQSDFNIHEEEMLSIIVFYFTFAIELILVIWTMVIFFIGTSEVQKFSIGKSILNMILSVLVISVPLILIALLGVVLR